MSQDYILKVSKPELAALVAYEVGASKSRFLACATRGVNGAVHTSRIPPSWAKNALPPPSLMYRLAPLAWDRLRAPIHTAGKPHPVEEPQL